MDKYVYIDIEAGDTDRERPAVIRVKAVKFGRNVQAEIFDKKCAPIRQLKPFAEKLLGVSNEELKKFAPQESVLREFIGFIEGAHIIAGDATFCERALGIKINDVRTLADVRRAAGESFFDERHFAVAEQAEKRDLTLADVQRITESAFTDACDVVDDLVFFGLLEKSGNVYKKAGRNNRKGDSTV